MKLTSLQFKSNAHKALHDKTLQRALKHIKTGFVKKRTQAVQQLPEFDKIRDYAVAIKNHSLENIDFYLEQFEQQVQRSDGQVHWARDAKEACQQAIQICQAAKAKSIVKGKSMLTEEIGLNEALEKSGFTVNETDLGEYIIQHRHETPSHIVAPAIHLVKEQVAETFHKDHAELDPDRSLDKPEELLQEARQILRQQFLAADVGITGANFLIAESGTTGIVTNEGNGDLSQILPKVHIVFASIEKIVPTYEDAMQIVRLLSRSATGQDITTYVTFSTGPKRNEDLDGPQDFHVILVDNGRTKMLGSEFQDMLRCIRCGACLNHCPVYDAIGGQAYGSMYPGPMGAVFTPSLFGIKESKDLPNASTFCGRCQAVCPMRIPLPDMMRRYREQEFRQHLSSTTSRLGLKYWTHLATRPKLYHKVTGLMIKALHTFAKKKGRLRYLPMATGWTKYRDFPAPAHKTFHQLWSEQQKSQYNE